MWLYFTMWLWIFPHNCDFISHNFNLFSRNCDLISYSGTFFSNLWLTVGHYFISKFYCIKITFTIELYTVMLSQTANANLTIRFFSPRNCNFSYAFFSPFYKQYHNCFFQTLRQKWFSIITWINFIALYHAKQIIS